MNHVLVRPCEVLVGDRDGIMVLPGEFISDVAADARKLIAVEETQRPRLARGDEPKAV